jgi:hypothetical protein
MPCQPQSCYRFAPIPDCLTTLRIKTTRVSADLSDKQVVRIKSTSNGKYYIVRRISNAEGIITIYLRTFTDELDITHEADLPFNLLNPWVQLFIVTVDNFTYQDCEGNNYPCMAFKVADTFDSETDYLLDFTVCGEPYQAFAIADCSNEYNT